MKIINKKLSELIPYKNNPRNNDAAVDGVAASIKEFGFQVPIVIDTNNVIVAGHTRYKAALKLGLDEVPCKLADELTPVQIKAYRLADNKVAEKSTWNDELTFLELSELEPLGVDMLQFGFEDLEKSIDEPKERKEVEYNESISVVIDCINETEAEQIYNDLSQEGYNCRISTL